MRAANFSLVSSVLCLLMAACSSPQQYNTAPMSEQEASEKFIISGSSADSQSVIAASSGYRVLSAKHNIYEVSGLSYAEIKSIAPTVSATQNQYFQVLNKENNPYQFLLADEEDTGATDAPADLPPALKGCNLEAEAQPTPVLQVSASVFAPNSPTMELGNKILFSGAASTPSVEGLDVEVRWDVITPDSSLLELELTVNDVLELEPDAMGLYQVIMVVKDANDACNIDVARFMVTSNPEFAFPEANEERPTLELEAFSQLPRVQAQESWELATGRGKTIAVLDTGLNFLHPAIKFNLATNDAEKGQATGADEDNNTFVDDVLGWDFVNGDNNPFDDEGHGSHVSGLAASHIFGLAKDAKVMPLKVMNAAGGGDLGTVVAAIYYAADNGADVVNASLQRLQGNIPELQAAVDYAHSKGVVMVFSSGNDTLDLSLPENQIYPGEIDAPNVINVAAIGVDANLATYSNFGKEETDVAAPGGDQGEPLFSLAPANPRGVAFVGSGGTSMAAPIVAGVAAQVLEMNGELSPREVRQILMSSGNNHDELKDVVGSGKILSALEAVETAQSMVMQRPAL